MKRSVGAAVALLAVLAAASAANGAPSAAEQRLAGRYAPVVALQEQKKPCGHGEPYRPISVGAVLGNSEVTLRGPGKGHPVVERAPTASDLYGKGEGYYLDFPGNPLDPGCKYEKEARRWNNGRPYVVYTHVATEAGRPGELALQYWFYYVFNDFNNKHESDWEMIQLVFHARDARAALLTHPYAVAYSQHEGGERAAWDDHKLQKEGTHPVVYPAAGSHANYYSAALWLGRSAKEGFGCDDTSPPSVRIRPTPLLVPTTAGRDDRDAWLGFTGRWGQRERGFNNGPTGPNTKAQWLQPIHWQEHEQRKSSVQIPALHAFGPSVTGFFCGAVSAGSNALTFTQQRPLLALAIALGVLALVILSLKRTRWSPVRTEPLRSARTIGQILRTAARVYRQHLRLFAGIGAVFLPIGLFFTGLEALLFEDLLGLTGLTGRNSGGGDAIGLEVGGAGITIATVIAVAATATALSEMAEGREPTVRSVYRIVFSRFWRLVWGLARAVVTVSLLALTIVGIPVAIERIVRWTFLPQMCVLGDGTTGPLRSSARLTRGGWWRTFALTAVMNVPIVVLALTVGTVLLLLVPAIPLYTIEGITCCVFALAYPFVGIATTLLYFDRVLAAPEPAPVAPATSPA